MLEMFSTACSLYMEHVQKMKMVPTPQLLLAAVAAGCCRRFRLAGAWAHQKPKAPPFAGRRELKQAMR
jgi:hypothetical protein